MVTPVDCKSAASGIVCSSHTFSTRTFRLVSGYSDPEDEKWGDSQGWYYSYRSSVSNTIAVPVGKRVEGAYAL